MQPKQPNCWRSEVKEDPQTGDLFIEFPDDLIEQMGWEENDTLSWQQGTDGSWIIRKSIDTKV